MFIFWHNFKHSFGNLDILCSLGSAPAKCIIWNYSINRFTGWHEQNLVEKPEDNFNATVPFDIYLRKLEDISMVKGYWDELRAWYVSFIVSGPAENQTRLCIRWSYTHRFRPN